MTSQGLAVENLINPASRQRRSARSLLLRMAGDQERADRIRQVRKDKHLRWKQIASYVGVEMRSAQMWQETGAISWDNAQKLAELAGVDPHWLMSGAETNTPDPFEPDSRVQEQLADIQQQLADARSERERIEAAIKTQNANLAAQTAILKRIEKATAKNDDSTQRLDTAAAEMIRLMREAESAAQSLAEARTGPGGSDSPPASN